LQEWESLEALKASVTIVETVRAPDMGVTLLVDNKNSVYAVDEAGDRSFATGTYAGGFGGGSILPTDTAVTAAIPFCLHAGDKTLVQLQKLSADEEGPKYMSGTLYSMLRYLETKGHHDIQLTKYGKCEPKTVNGQRCYEFPEDNKDQNFDYVLTASTAVTKADNVFRSGAWLP
jgi:hypothetical protein